jgi:alkylation response protein AidB-like acyl-CoA dehydrogenase
MTLLGYERGEAASTTPIMYRTELDRLLALAREYGKVNDPVIRQKLAWCYSKVEIMRFLGMRALSSFLAGNAPGPEGSIFKIFWSEYQQVSTELAMAIMGPSGLVPTGRAPSGAFQTDDPGAPNSTASWATVFLNARAGTIYAGTSQIQRNIIGEMVLGLPKEPRQSQQSWAESRS